MSQVGRLPQSVTTKRMYASSPQDDYLVSSFSRPFAHFVHTISSIARMILLTSAGVMTVGALTFEGVHQYVEHIAMPRTQIQSQDDDPWGWVEELQEHNWGVGKGTDSRLGIRGRHTLRSAWICANWGGGISPSSLVSAGAGVPTIGGKRSSSSSSYLSIDEGLAYSERFLKETLNIAEDRKISIPDVAAIRAGVKSPNTAAARQPLDLTAVSLECKLASVRERLGMEESLKGALSGYTRVFDVLSSLNTTNESMNSEGHSSGQPSIRTERLVRLATKVGDLHHTLGRRDEAERWLLHAISLAGHEAEISTGDTGRVGIVKNQIVAGKGGLSPSPEEIREVDGALHGRREKLPPHVTTTSVPLSIGMLSAEAPSPALTRSLISTLLSLSAFYAQPDNRVQMEKALQFQAGALRLARVEKQRLSLSDNQDQVGPSLHSLWLLHHDALACIHIAETIYALGSKGSAHSTFGALKNTIGLGSKADKHVETLEWLQEAEQNARLVATELTKKSTKIQAETLLKDKWTSALQWKIPAERLLRDTGRLKLTIEEMRKALS
ncbi:hypothetical protein CBS101457_001132 [Exobasidium rhododendri]|nr:hypothetical protein CBS101457_001132 [Exobasidium rhododendri]